MSLNEDTLVQQTTADYLRDSLGWESVYAYNQEGLGPGSLLGRESEKEVVLVRYLRQALLKLNPGLPDSAYDDAVRQLVEYSASQTPLATNREKDELLRDGVVVAFRNARGEQEKRRLRVFDFENPLNNHFLCVRELWIKGDLYRRRADIVGFVNGIPLLFMECKNVHKDLRHAFEANISDYKDTIPHIFHHNAIIALANGVRASIGSVSSKFEHFHEWKRLAEDEPGVVDMETLLKGVCSKANLLDIFENFVVFDESGEKPAKIIGHNHQLLGVNRAIEALKDRKCRNGRLGVFWHTQGSGKSYSMVFFTRKVHRKLGGNFTFLICTDRDDLDTQIYKTFAGCGIVDNDKDPCRAASGEHLRELLGQHKGHVFTLIQKFNRRVFEGGEYSLRDDIVVISDEAHRTQYGELALNMRDAIPNASYIGFTGTPLFKDDEITRRVFGDYVSTYDFQRAVDDKATVPLYYDARGEKLGIATTSLNTKIADVLERVEIDDVDVQQKLEAEIKREYHILTAGKRLDQLARDFVEHYSTSWETGKAMIVCIDKITCVRLYNLIDFYWKEKINELDVRGGADEQEDVYLRRKVLWMKETLTAVVVSEEQGEVARFRKWDLDIQPHRKLIKDGFSGEDGKRIDLEEAFKRDGHPFRVVIVCAMWLTGFDVRSLANLYLDKPLKAHTLMQAIARANRVHEGKNNGLVIDYCGILKNLRKALATFTVTTGGENEGLDPARPKEELLEELAEAIELVRVFLRDNRASLDDIIEKTGFARNLAIFVAKEAANQNDETRKQYEIMARQVFVKFKACLTLDGVQAHRSGHEAVSIVYKSLQDDRYHADVSHIIRLLHGVVDEAIETHGEVIADSREARPIYDISKIDFDKLRREFERSTNGRASAVQCLRDMIAARLQKLLAQNPLRTDFQTHFERIVADYNAEKDRAVIEATWEALLKFMEDLNEEDSRAIRERLDEESLAVFDLLRKPDLSPSEIDLIKKVSVELLTTLKAEKLRIQQWSERDTTRAAVRQTILNFLYADQTGLPASYSLPEIDLRTDAVLAHMIYAYPTMPSPIYSTAL